MHRLTTALDATAAALVRVAHSSTTLAHGLEPGEVVVLTGADGEHHLGAVVDLEFELHDTVYVLEVGARVPAETADRLVAGAGEPRGQEGVTAVMELLGELRRRAVRPGR